MLSYRVSINIVDAINIPPGEQCKLLGDRATYFKPPIR